MPNFRKKDTYVQYKEYIQSPAIRLKAAKNWALQDASI